jgi:hypothetical protein
MPAHLKFLLGLYLLHPELHQKQGHQTSVHQGWYMVLQSPHSLMNKLSKKNMHSMHVFGSWSAYIFGSPGHGNNQASPCTSHVFSTGSKGTTTMQKPGNDAKDFGLSRQVVHR